MHSSILLMSTCTEKKCLTRFLFMPNASWTGINRVCQLLEGKAIDAVLSICHLIIQHYTALHKPTAEAEEL